MLDSNPGQYSGVMLSKVRGQRAGYDVSPGSLYRFKGQGSTHCFDNKTDLVRHCCFLNADFLLVLSSMREKRFPFDHPTHFTHDAAHFTHETTHLLIALLTLLIPTHSRIILRRCV